MLMRTYVECRYSQKNIQNIQETYDCEQANVMDWCFMYYYLWLLCKYINANVKMKTLAED